MTTTAIPARILNPATLARAAAAEVRAARYLKAYHQAGVAFALGERTADGLEALRARAILAADVATARAARLA